MMIDIVLEMHWSNNPIPLNQLVTEPDFIFDIPLGLFTSFNGSTQSVNSVNGRTGYVVLNADDVGADQVGAANQVKSELENTISNVLALAQTNELKIGTKADQLDLETTQIQVENNRLAILTKADIQSLALLAQLVDTKADQSYVNQQIADLVGSAPEALNTIYELAAAIQNDQSLIDSLNQSVANRVRFDIATQALTEIHKQNARTNIGAEQIGTAQQLISQITAQSLGAATAAQGAKADTALQSADVAPVALSGLFSSLSGQNKIFDVVFNAYIVGSNTAISATDTLGQMLSKLQGQISAIAPPTWVNVNTLSGYLKNNAVTVSGTKIEIAKINGMIWLRGFFTANNSISSNSFIFSHSDPNYLWDNTYQGSVADNLYSYDTTFHRHIYANELSDIRLNAKQIGSGSSPNISHNFRIVLDSSNSIGSFGVAYAVIEPICIGRAKN
ncbi:hypothetical protein [Acinetobacter junii]|uniref:hypothetical protein n=1 Tax=Acinetobacter junii TaxID=40215 RepID=UPI00100DDB1B|nr:hypothetical protein [Acinetobacter junii]RXS94870.1 hypothetical protein ETZ13_09750 [Acinetobacter junii]